MLNLAELKKEYDSINAELGKNEAVLNMEKAKPLLKRQKELAPFMEKYDRLQAIEIYLAENENLAKTEKDNNFIEAIKEDIKKLAEEKKNILAEIEKMNAEPEENDKGILMEIRAGAGGDEAALFAAELMRMYTRFAESRGWKIELLSSHRIGIGGFKEIITLIHGKNAFKTLKNESGVHRVQRIPATEKSGRVHTSTVSVAIVPEKAEIDIKINPSDLKIDVMRSSGPGGQNVNKTESAVRMTHLPTGIMVYCQDEKSQLKNRERAMKILCSRIFALEKDRREKEEREKRREQIGFAERSEKTRTYNFPQDRVTDHRLKKSFHNINKIMDGGLDEIIESFKKQPEKT